MSDEFKYQTLEEIDALQTFPEPDGEEDADGPASEPGYVYFVTEIGTNNFKVGRTGNPKQRFSALRSKWGQNLQMRPEYVSNMLEAERSLLCAMRADNQDFVRLISRGTEWFSENVAEAQGLFMEIVNRY